MKTSLSKFAYLLLALSITFITGCNRIPLYRSTPAQIPITQSKPTLTRIPTSTLISALTPLPTQTLLQTEVVLSTPIPDLDHSIAAMPAQPPHGIAGKDTIGDPYIPELGNTGYDVRLYNLAFDIAPALKVITATAIISATSTLDDLGRISLDFEGFQTDQVSLNGDSVPYYRSQNKLYVDLPHPFAKDEKLKVQINYHGEMKPQYTPYISAFQIGFSQPKEDRLFVFAEPDGARAWFPSNDHPLDKAAFRMEVTVPAGLTAVSNGDLIATQSKGNKTTYSWYEEDPMATYLATLAVGPYEQIDTEPFGNTQLRYYVFMDDPLAKKFVQMTPQILQFLTDLIGPYPFDEFGYVEVIAPGLAMETQTMVMVDQSILDGDPSSTLVHEAAHHWFGDSVSLGTWAEIWLNEGFAQYIQVLWDIKHGANLQTLLGEYEQGILNREHEESAPLDQPSKYHMFGTNTYIKGAWILYMLNQELGDELFFKIIRTYYQRYAGGNATTADFKAVAEEVSGKVLNTFFEQWVESSGNPHLQISWTSQLNGNGSQATIQLCQTQTGTTYNFPLEIDLSSADGNGKISTIQVDERQENTTFQLPFEPATLIADPNQKVLADISVTKVDRITTCSP